jgi:predicted GH43/DUF377 family glycosyl hydrolase
MYRYHPKADFWRTQLALWDGERPWRIKPPETLSQYSIEDGRFFIHKGKLMISYVVARTINNLGYCVVQYGELEKDGHDYKIVNHYQIKYGRNDFTAMEKNWSLISRGDDLFVAYLRSPEQVILQIDKDRVIAEHRTKTPQWDIGQVRGGTFPIEHRGLWLQFFHSAKQNKGQARAHRYYVGALLMETQPPFQIVSVSKKPILVGNENYFPGSKSWKPNVFIPYGAIKSGDRFHISGGYNDSATFTSLLTEEELNL